MDAPKGRGASSNPPNRFKPILYESVAEECAGEPGPATRFFEDDSRTILSENDSPDVGFSVSVNPYRGCEHGCAYCYARPTHEYLELSAGLDFETKIFVKTRAPALLAAALASPRWRPRTIAMSGVTDCYQPAERHFRVTRGCLETLVRFRNPVGIVTKNHLVTRDIDLLRELARHDAALVALSVTTLDADLAGRLEPRASRPQKRLDAITRLAEAGVPAGVMVAPIVPGLTDHEAPAILKAARAAGARFAGYTILRLPHGVKDLFAAWLARHVPGAARKVLGRVRAVRGGRLNDARFSSRMRGEGLYADQIAALFAAAARRAGFGAWPSLSTAAFRRPGEVQAAFFDDAPAGAG